MKETLEEEPNPFELPKALPDDVFYESLEEPKQETLEEAAERISKEHYVDQSDYWAIGVDSFKRGAKWQQERMYSEEEVKRIAFDFYYDISHKIGVPENLISENATNVDVWFKQFKEK